MDAFSLEMRKIPVDKTPRQLDFPLSPDIVKDDTVAITDPASGKTRRVNLDDRLQGFVLLPQLIGFPDCIGKRKILERFRFAFHDPF